MNAPDVSATHPRRLRRRLIVDRRLQLDLALRAGAYCAFVMIAVGAALFGPMIQEFRESSDLRSREDLATVILYLHRHFWPIAGACVLLALGVSILDSHRIAGPLVRAKRHMAMVGRGVLPSPLRTRRRDYLKIEVDVLNRMVEDLAERFEVVKAGDARLADALAQCQRVAAQSDDAALSAAVECAEAAARDLHGRIDGFLRADGADVIPRRATEPSEEPVPV